ncbi:SMI1 / KNR4 family (SUKH-1) [Chitinophaga rupis]|uniref:SMI1 / KNR4 family (SUKH-1) n=1 Tax=Chitinophaga rupis TaxID=573321 RepID=A0A1H7YIA8_9BACT|nr:SMI1/KNR4 family protein [Chitinophaga rupis]SEM45986.1 SMI1 / KNR4 family (SUKH-1) [Chitinophaga rupis]
MTDYNEQVQRIKQKLPAAKKADRRLKVFGAESHKYTLNKPATAEEVTQFEQQYAIELPECYKAFLLQIGNGGNAHANSAAGPFYGIYPLGGNVDELIYDTVEKHLKNDCVIYPKMPDDYWAALTQKINDDDNLSDEDYENEKGRILGGILPIGSQGCSYLHGIILNGPYKGRVVNLDTDFQKPKFTYESNFLDWYERWLDEVISGQLMQEGPRWFGYSMGGSDDQLLKLFLSAKDEEQKADCLNGLLNKYTLQKEIVQNIEQQVFQHTPGINAQLLQILCKFDYEKAKPYLIELVKTDLLSVFQFVYWYAKDKSKEWAPVIEANISRIDDGETFRFCTYLLTEIQSNFGPLIIPFTEKKDENIRVTAFYTLGKLNNRKDFIAAFIKGLQDPSNHVIHSALQALSGVKDKRLLPYYKQLAEKFPVEQNYILSNLNYRLAEYGLTNVTVLRTIV